MLRELSPSPSGTWGRIAALLEAVAGTAAVPGAAAPTATCDPDELVERLEAAPELARWRPLVVDAVDLLADAADGPVACHGDLWAGNVLCADGRVWLIDPAPTAASVVFDVARVAADGWAGPGVEGRVGRLCAHLGVDPAAVWPLVAVFAARQASTFHHHRWDPTPVRAGLDDVYVACARR